MLTVAYLRWCANASKLRERLKALDNTDHTWYIKWGWGDLVKEIIFSILDVTITDEIDQCDLDNMACLKDGDTLFFFWAEDKRHHGQPANIMYTYLNTSDLPLYKILEAAPMPTIDAILYIAEHMILENLDYVMPTESGED